MNIEQPKSNVLELPVVKKLKLAPGLAINPLCEQEYRNKKCVCLSGLLAKKCCGMVDVILQEDADMINAALRHQKLAATDRKTKAAIDSAMDEMKKDGQNGQDSGVQSSTPTDAG